MKKTSILIAAAVVSLAAASCAKEMAPSSGNLVKVSFKADFQPADKAGLTDGKTIGWEASDSIAVWDGTAARVFHAASVDGSSATFFGEVEEGATEFYLVSPFAAFKSVAEGVLTVSVPASQKAVADGIDPAALVQTAYTDDLTTGVSFKNAVSLVKFTIDREGISRIQLSGNAAEKICGNATTDATGETITGAGSASLSVAPESGEFENGTYYAAIVPTSFGSGIKVCFAGTTKGILSTASAIEFPRNGGRNLGAIASNAKTVTVPDPIMTTEQLMTFHELAGLYAAGETAKLGADISLEGETWTPIDFAGDFDGQGHAITGISITNDGNAGFFKSFKGAMKDITFGSAAAHGTITSTASAATPYVGIVAQTSGTASLTNVTSYVDVVYAGHQEKSAVLGGIVGDHGSTGTVSGCKYYGKVSLEVALLGANAHNMGGIIGNVTKVSEVKDCINYGTVYSAPTTMGGSPNIGGILGYTAVEGVKVNGCVNEGTVEFAGETALPEGVTSCGGQTSLGGIVGYHNTKPMTISGCVNKGTVRRSATKMMNHVYLGGIVGYDNNKNIITDCSNEGLVENVGAMGGRQLFIGGIAGGSKGAASTFLGCTNKSTAHLNCSASATYIHIGGIVGESGIAGDVIGTAEKPCANEGTITNSGNSSNGATTLPDGSKGNNPVPNISLGGLVGWSISPAITKATNSGAITNTGGLSYDQNIITAGGIAGTLTGAGSISDCKNSGAIVENGTVHIPVSYAGGILGYTMTTAMSGISGCENSGAISFSGAKRSIVAGGIAGYVTTATPISNCTNTATGTVTAGGTTTSLTHLAGIAGYITGAQETKDCSNAADIAVTAKGAYVYCGGVVGRVEVSGSKITNCTNTGDFIQSAANTSDGGIRCGGIAGQVRYVVIDGCTQSGDVKNTSTEVTKTHYLGGFVGLNNTSVATIKNCKILKGEISTASTATHKLGAFLNTTIATKVTDNGISGNVKVGDTEITSENYNTSSLLNGHSGSPVYSGTYFIAE